MTLGTLTLDKILEWNERISKDIPRQIILGNEENINFDCYSKFPKTIELIARLDNDGKDSLETIKENGTWQELKEDETLLDYVWITNLEFEWRGNENYDKPWYSTIRLLCSGN